MRKTSILAALALSAFAGTMVACGEDDELTDIDIDEEFAANLNANQVVPVPLGSPTATGVSVLSLVDNVLTVALTVNGTLTSGVTQAHIHGPVVTGNSVAPIILDLASAITTAVATGTASGTIVVATFDLNDLTQVNPLVGVDAATFVGILRAGQAYIDVHTVLNPDGEIRGQIFQNFPD